MPKSRVDFWRAKLEENAERDARQNAKLAENGWTVLTMWECETRDASALQYFVRNVKTHLAATN